MLLLTGIWWVSASAQTPEVTIDGNPETPGVSPAPTAVIAGEKLMVAVTIENARNVHSYSVKIAFDPHVVTFSGATVRLSPLTPVFLESGKGTIAAFLPIPGDGQIEIAAAQSGKNPSQCANGSGTLGYLSFTACGNGNPGISVLEARLVDSEGTITPTDVR
jgi:hypothetical protein